jgi:hypothetical protein
MSAAKIAAKQKNVELAIRAESMKKRQAIEAERLRLKQQEEQLQLQEDLAVSEAQADIFEKFETKSNKSKSVHSVNSDCVSKNSSVLRSGNNDAMMAVVHQSPQ